MNCSVFENIYEKESPHNVEIIKMLHRIRDGASRAKCEAIRACLDKDKADLLKQGLPCVCFSGTFTKRYDGNIVEHSGFFVLDFDNVYDIGTKMVELTSEPWCYAAWLSPRGNGIKVLVRIAEPKRHRDHFAAMLDLFPKYDTDGKKVYKMNKKGDKTEVSDIDKSGVNESRVCYESYDPNIYINTDAEVFTRVKTVSVVEMKETEHDQAAIFKRLLSWLSNRNDAFVSGERNTFIFKLASACCRYGIGSDTAEGLILREFPVSNDFSQKECKAAIASGYRASKSLSGTAIFDKDVLVEVSSSREVEIKLDTDEEERLRDIVYGQDVKGEALDIYNDGYLQVPSTGVVEIDKLFKMKRCEITLLTGIGNYGKSAFKKWYQVLRAVLFDEKFASFPPEDYPVHSYYHELTEILLGCDCTPKNPGRPSMSEYSRAYDWISAHFFYIHPTDLSPTPDYMKERFLELIVKEKIDGCDIDPFNQMTNDYGKHGGRSDKYLETVLSDFLRFAQQNNVYFWIVAHPVKMTLSADKNYPCPNVFDVADGAMWNNKMNNILVYHRPLAQTAPNDALCEFHSKKIKDQKTVGMKGDVAFQYNRKTRRFEFDGKDYLTQFITDRKISFK